MLPLLMKILVIIAVLAFVTVFVVLGAMWWRLRRHLRRSDRDPEQAAAETQQDRERSDKN